jgi:hypothetical protein
VQTEVKAPTKKAKTTLWPKKSLKLLSSKLVSGKVKSGALSPTFILFGISKEASNKNNRRIVNKQSVFRIKVENYAATQHKKQAIEQRVHLVEIDEKNAKILCLSTRLL